MSIGKANRMPRLTSGPKPENAWRDKVHPFFVKAAEFNRKVVILSRSDAPEDRLEAVRLNDEGLPKLLPEADFLHEPMKAAGQIRHIGLLKALAVAELPAGTSISRSEFMCRWLCWFRFRKTLATLKREYQSGEPKAVEQMHKLALEFDRWKIGKVDPNRLEFKSNPDHFTLMNAGLGLGLENLTANELAACFAELCPCKEEHIPESLSKLRARILKEFPPKSGSDP